MTNEKGSVSLLALGSFAALLLICAFALNISWNVYAKSQAQAAVDAAALSAATAIPSYNKGDTTVVKSLVEAFNGNPQDPNVPSNLILHGSPDISFENDAKFINYDGQIPAPAAASNASANGLSITKTYRVPPFFGGKLAFFDSSVTVTATAVLGGPSCATPRLPFALLDCQFPGLTNHCALGCNAEGLAVFAGSLAPKNTAAYFGFNQFSWDDPSSGSASATKCISSVTQQPYPTSGSDGTQQFVSATIPQLCAGTLIRLNNGQLDSCLKAMGDECATTTNHAACSAATPWEVYAPVISCNDLKKKQNGDYEPVQDVPLSGFALIGITEVKSQGGDKYVRFILRCGHIAEATGGGKSCGLTGGSPILVE